MSSQVSPLSNTSNTTNTPVPSYTSNVRYRWGYRVTYINGVRIERALTFEEHLENLRMALERDLARAIKSALMLGYEVDVLTGGIIE